MSIGIYLDDLKNPPFSDWFGFRSVQEAQDFVMANPDITYMSLDHDLGLTDDGTVAPTGLDFLKWLHENGYWPKTRPHIHSQSPLGAQKMRDFIKNFGPY